MLDELLRVWDGSLLGAQRCSENISRRCMDWRRLEVRNNFLVGVSHSACRERCWMSCYGYGTAVSSVCNIVLRTSRGDVWDWRRLEVRNYFPTGVSHSACRERCWMNCYGYGTVVSSVLNVVLRTSRGDVWDWRRLEVRNNFLVGVSHSACRERCWMSCYGYGTAVSSVCNIVLRTSRGDVWTGVG